MATPSRPRACDELLAQSDVVTLHVPETSATHGMIGREEIAAIKPGAYFINNSRGTVVDLQALADALREGRLRGAAVDVFPVEPRSNADPFVSPLQGLENVILTPHIGGSTEEAQERIGAEVARKLVDYSNSGSTMGAVNFPQVQLPPRPSGTRFIQVQRNLPGMLGRLNEVLARHAVNIAAQYYETDHDVGYVVLDADASAADGQRVLADIRALEGTIRARLLYEYRDLRPALASLRGAPAPKQSAFLLCGAMDCVASLAMTAGDRGSQSYDSRISSNRRPSVLSSFFTALEAAISPWLA